MKSVGILEDNFSLRKNIEAFLKLTNEYEVVFSEASFSDIDHKAVANNPDFILLDIHLKDDTLGIDLIGKILRHYPKTAIIIITGDTKDEYVLKALENGAKGYLYKPFTLEVLKSTMETVAQTGSFLQQESLTKLLDTINKSNQQDELKTKFKLTSKEVEIIGFLKKGLSYKEIAGEMNVSYHTVNHHLKNIYLKMDVSSMAQLFAKYF